MRQEGYVLGAVASAICLAASAICLAAFRALNRPRRSRFFISSLRRIRFALFQLNRLVQPRTSQSVRPQRAERSPVELRGVSDF